MIIKSLSLDHFRNYETLAEDFSPRVNIITGENGEGKTNLLEAIYIMSMGRSFRTHDDVSIISFDAPVGRVKGLFEKESAAQSGELSIEVRIARAGHDKRIVIDGVTAAKHAELAGRFCTVLFSPDDLRVISGEPELRRRFVDRELFQIRPKYYLDVTHYRKAMSNRNMLLRDPGSAPELINVYDAYLAETGASIMMKRADFVSKIAPIAKSISEDISGGKESMLLTYEPDIDVGDIVLSEDTPGTKEALRERILAALAERTERDRYLGTTGCGPHKDELKMSGGGVDLRKYGSRGQQRTAALALKLSELALIYEETGDKAVLLLDDVLSELDAGRQSSLIKAFEGHQIFITAADLPGDMLEKLKGSSVYCIKKGEIAGH